MCLSLAKPQARVCSNMNVISLNIHSSYEESAQSVGSCEQGSLTLHAETGHTAAAPAGLSELEVGAQTSWQL